MSLDFTGERIVPGQVTESLFSEHEVRYQLASKYVKDKNVLDVACGTGIGTDFLRQCGAACCTGMDIDPAAIEYASSNYPDCRFLVSDATKMEAEDASFDVVVSFETLEHIPNPEAFLSECARVLKPGGTFICSTPNRIVNRWWGKNPYHHREYTRTEFSRLLERYFRLAAIYSQDSVVYPTFVARRIASRAIELCRLTTVMKRLRQPPVERNASRLRFDARENDHKRIRPLDVSWISQPSYILAVVQKH